MIIQASDCSPAQIYYLMVQTIIPRPIAWVLTSNRDGSHNLAPFSYFNGVCSDPPVLMISVGKKRTGERKDTWVNIEERETFVVHVAGAECVETVKETAVPYEYGDSEVTKADLELTPVEGWPLPRLTRSRAAFWCRRYGIHEIGPKPQALILGEILGFWLDPAVASVKDDRVVVDPLKLDPLGRVGHEGFNVLQLKKEV